MKDPQALEFGHPPSVLEGWRRKVQQALEAGAQTPFYLGDGAEAAGGLAELDALKVGRPVRQWLSCKTQPARPWLRWWRGLGRPIEVVSEFECRAALAEGFEPAQILVNGPAKHRWLARMEARGLRVNLDSPGEMHALAGRAKSEGWHLGLRLRTEGEIDPENPDRPTQFGFEPGEIVEAVRWLRRRGLELETLSYHLRTNITSADFYGRAIDEAAQVCAAAGFSPRHIDVGGGLPPPYVLSKKARRLDAEMRLETLAGLYRAALKRFPAVAELWMENGRFLLARTGLLAVRVLEEKNRCGLRQLICDGGRTMNALLSTWENHALIEARPRRGKLMPTVVHGPTCMAFDQLGYRPMPGTIRAGDVLLWLDAGAYHLPWETHFSHGLAEVWWMGENGPQRERPAESFEDFWGRWRSDG